MNGEFEDTCTVSLYWSCRSVTVFERFFKFLHGNFVKVFVPKISNFPILRLRDRIQSKLNITSAEN